MKAFDGSWVALGFAVPVTRWPLAWHGAAAFGLVALLAAGAWLLHEQQLRRAAAATADLRSAQAQLQALRAQPAPHLAPQPALADASEIDRVLTSVSEYAAARQVRVTSIKVENGAGQIRIATRAVGDYHALKAWLGGLMVRHPSLLASTVVLRRVAPDATALDASIGFTLFVKGER